MKITTLHAQQIGQMLDIQDAAEVALDPNWKNLGWPFGTAIIVEVGELMERTSWKWWKDTNKRMTNQDVEQTQLELVDIWHFGMCLLLQENNREGAIQEIQRALGESVGYIERAATHASLVGFTAFLIETVPNLVSQACVNRFVPLDFFIICAGVGLEPIRLYNLYIAKNVLNQFRQNNGYKEGTYHKLWQGREDNLWLMDIINENPVVTVDMLWEKLYNMYANRDLQPSEDSKALYNNMKHELPGAS